MFRRLLIAFSSSFLIFGLIFQVLGKKTETLPLKGSDFSGPSTEAKPPQKDSKELSCFKDKDRDGKVELSLLNQKEEEKEPDCLLMGCNIYELH